MGFDSHYLNLSFNFATPILWWSDSPSLFALSKAKYPHNKFTNARQIPMFPTSSSASGPANDKFAYIKCALATPLGNFQEIYKTHEFALDFLVMMVTLTYVCTPLSPGKELIKFAGLNALVVLSRHKRICYEGVETGLHLGYLARGVHDLAMWLLGQWIYLPSGAVFTLWSLANMRYFG